LKTTVFGRRNVRRLGIAPVCLACRRDGGYNTWSRRQSELTLLPASLRFIRHFLQDKSTTPAFRQALLLPCKARLMVLNLSQRLLLVYTLLIIGAAVPRIIAGQEPGRYDAVIHRADELAEQYRDLERGSKEAQRLQEQLRNSLSQAFQLRQAQQRAELKTLREQLESAEQRLSQREELMDRIVERKLEDLLQGANADWPENDSGVLDKQLAFDVIEVGDTVAVYIDSILPPHGPQQRQSAPPITTLPSGRVVSGFPFVVASDGTIQLPHIPPVKIAGLSIREAERRINQTYVEKKVLVPKRATTILTLVPCVTAGAGQ
jgi:hypothetical protein